MRRLIPAEPANAIAPLDALAAARKKLPSMRMSFVRRAADAAPSEEARSKTGGLVRLVVIVLLLAWAIRSFIVAPFSIPSGSMLPTLFIGDYVLVAKWPYGYSRYSFPFGFPSFDGRILGAVPDRGDIVIFRAPGDGRDFVKRVIGLPGDTVEVRGGMLLLNGRAIPRQPDGLAEIPITPNSPCKVVPGATPQVTADGVACRYPAYRETLPDGASWLVLDQVENPRADDVRPTVVPDGHLFLMGDNRDDSLDSRFTPAEGGIGIVPLENLIGRGLFIYWSTDGGADYLKPWTWFTGLRGGRIGPISTGPDR
jgi:signal peptidase I